MSEPGRGTTFRVLLPMTPAEQPVRDDERARSVG
jgi:hypothetical protein